MVKRYKKGQTTNISAHFRFCEFDCHGSDCGYTYIDDGLVALLERIRAHFNRAIIITSGYRCPSHNAAVGGGTQSFHKRGMAADIVVDGIKPIEVAQYAESIGVLGIGLYDSFVHVDTRLWKSFWKTSRQIPTSSFGCPPKAERPNNPTVK